jgi:phosphatidate phosphatase APP1
VSRSLVTAGRTAGAVLRVVVVRVGAMRGRRAARTDSGPVPVTLPSLHRAARFEDAVGVLVARVLRRRGWHPRVLPYAGYGATGGGPDDGWVRVLARVLLCPSSTHDHDLEGVRGWRRFLSAAVADVPVHVRAGSRDHVVRSGRGGYLDAVLATDLPPGPGAVTLSVPEGHHEDVAQAPVFVAGPDTRVGLVSDIDDTVLITAMPRPLLAFWNTFVLRESDRRPVPGMADLYRELVSEHPSTMVVYLSTGAWNVAPALSGFLARHGFPPGPLLMTDWGPTPDGWFRSGRLHKKTQLARLMSDLPGVRWVLFGDDGQHDPQLYRQAAADHPGRVMAIAVRRLSPTEQVLTHGTPLPLPDLGQRGVPTADGSTSGRSASVSPGWSEPVQVRGPDGLALREALHAAGVLRDVPLR